MLSNMNLKRPTWQIVMVVTLAFWLSGSLLLDTVMMPVMYASGMMTEPGFATAGYSMFWVFNRLELFCAALIFTLALVLRFAQPHTQPLNLNAVAIAAVLLDIALIYTYGLTPQMSALGVQLDLFGNAAEPPVLMNVFHASYWLLEVMKLVAAGMLLKIYYGASSEPVTDAV